MLKDEVKRLEQVKGVRSQLQGGKGAPMQQNPTDELIKLRGENGRLKNQVKCGEIELQNLKEKCEKMMMNGMGGEDPRLQQFQQQM